ncbi:hypothetical protein C0995_015123 [Termitomyces sp. Mi166|nr:hypothetical protein C0995_015123 [Termitomyces sp. Mi166\
MPKASKGQKFYAVQKGRQTGVFLTWEDCEKQTKGYPGAKYQGFTNAADAEAFVSGTLSSSAPKSSSSGTLNARVKKSSASLTSSSSGVSNAKGKKRAMPRDVADESEYDVVYCDGACKGNGQEGSIAGVGVWWEENDPRNIAERCPGDQTNNRAELIVCILALIDEITTDHWLPKWERNNFRTAGGDPVKNIEIIKYVSALLEVRALVGQPVHMEYVKGHSGDRGNDGADAEANKGALLPPVSERDWTKAKQELLEQFEEERRSSEDGPTQVPLNVNAGELEQPTNQPRKVRKVSHDLPSSRLSSVPASTKPSNSEPLSTEPSTPPHLPSPAHVTSSPPSLPIIEVPSSPLQETRPSQAPLTIESITANHSPSPPNITSLPPPLPIIEVSLSPLQETGLPEAQPMLPEEPMLPEAQPTTTSPPCISDLIQLEPEPENTKPTIHIDSQTSMGDLNKPLEAPKTPVRKHGVGLFTATPPPNAGFVRKFSTTPCEPQETKESESILQGQENLEKPMAMNVDVVDVDSNVVAKEESVPQDQDKTEKWVEEPMSMSVDAMDVDLSSESVPGDQEKTEKPKAMSVDEADVDLNDYLDCVDEDDDPLDDL